MNKETKDFIWIVIATFAMCALPMVVFLVAGFLSDNAAPIVTKQIELRVKDE